VVVVEVVVVVVLVVVEVELVDVVGAVVVVGSTPVGGSALVVEVEAGIDGGAAAGGSAPVHAAPVSAARASNVMMRLVPTRRPYPFSPLSGARCCEKGVSPGRRSAPVRAG